MDERRGERRGEQRVTIAEASAILGISKDAVRMRIKRGTLSSEKTEGRVYVYLNDVPDADANAVHPQAEVESSHEHVASLQDQIRYLREQLDAEREARTEERRRHDTLLAQLMQRIPELEAPTRSERDSEAEAREQPGAAETVEEAPERTEPHSATAEAQEDRVHPQERNGWLRPVDKLPWWRYLLGIVLLFLAVYLTLNVATDLAAAVGVYPYSGEGIGQVPDTLTYTLTLLTIAVLLVGTTFFPPAIFGLWIGYRRRNLRLWSQVLPLGALVGGVALLGALYGGNLAYVSVMFEYDYRAVLLLVFFPSWLTFVSASLVGNTWQRRHIKHISGTTPASPISRSAVGTAEHPRKDLTPAQQAMLGWGGAIISALISLVGTIITVRSGG